MIRVEQPGLLSTIQDRGRSGWQHLGITPGGVMDSYSAAVANILVGNPPDAAVLEITLHGPRLRFESGAWLAVTGADLSPFMEGSAVPGWRPVWLPAGSRLRFGPPRSGCRAYLAVAGGFAVPPLLGSRSTDLRAGFGGLEGRPLRANDVLAHYAGSLPIPDDSWRLHALNWFVAWSQELSLGGRARLRFVPGPDWTALPLSGQHALAGETYRISATSDRMGLRLEGPPLVLPSLGERLSAGVAFGTLQLPPGGQPILLGVDRQTTGGYPVLGTVASVDHPRLAQLRPGHVVHFEPIAVEEAQELNRQRAERLRRLRASLGLRWPLSGKTHRGAP
ncbi:MAG TPA: biotin-dependent carboxyltransferase family protein [Methylococcaceae bacterium]|nr:biotin-dependent carboxyltransferase family protein [Methylococcaceae bacterium]